MRRKICIFTGTRADYGLLKPLMVEIHKNTGLELQIVASGMHLSPEFGFTYKEIENDGFKINEKVEILLSSDTDTGVVKSTALGMIGYVESLNRLQPDLVVILGDRFEALAFAYASFVLKIPIAHISGGEITEGVIDDSIRHAITKFSHLHFVATDEYRKRVIQMGEEPDRVFNVGEIGLAGLKDDLLTKDELESSLNFRFGKKNILVTYHPVTLNKNNDDFKEILNALDELKNINIIFTKSNADSGGREINMMIDEFVRTHNNSISFISLGRRQYLSTIKYVDIVLGNSSSGIVEVPSFRKATINIGDRQRGRIKAKSIIDCETKKEDILRAIKQAYSTEFQEVLKTIKNPYEKENGLEEMLDIIKNVDLSKSIRKKFFNINYTAVQLRE